MYISFKKQILCIFAPSTKHIILTTFIPIDPRFPDKYILIHNEKDKFV